MDYWWIGYALAILAGIIFSVYGLWDRYKKDQEREATKISHTQV